MRKFFKTLIAAAVAVMAASCSTPQNIAYFQDIVDGSVDTISAAKMITIRPGDKISIIVNSRDPQISSIFNLSYASRYVGEASSVSSSAGYSAGVQGYAVATDGSIDFPILGKVSVGGKTREEIAELIKSELTGRDLVKDPVITVEYLNLKVSVLGEVNRPGRIVIDRDEYTIMDAISAAGDLTIFGLRESIRVIRTEGGTRKTYMVNMCSAEDLVNSPAYYLQQNDIIVVDPNDVRARQSTVNGNTIRTASFWISLASLASTVTNTIVVLMKL